MKKTPFYIFNFNFDISVVFQIRNNHEYDKSINYLAKYNSIQDLTTVNSNYIYIINGNKILKIVNKNYYIQYNYIKFTKKCYIINSDNKNDENDVVFLIIEYFHNANKNGTTFLLSFKSKKENFDNEIKNKIKFDASIYATALNKFLYFFFPKILINESNLIIRPIQQILEFILNKVKLSKKFTISNIKMQNKGEEIIIFLKENNKLNVRIFLVKLSNISTFVLLSKITKEINEVRNIKLTIRYMLKRVKEILENDLIRE
jgi:hypothetical protein